MDLNASIQFFQNLQKEVQNTQITLVTKGVESAFLLDFIEKTGHLNYGENYTSELSKWDTILEKFPALNLSFIGSFQSGNLKKITKYCNTIESVSSVKHLKKIKAVNNKIKVFAQINIGDEEQKNGFSYKNLNTTDLVQFDGIMCIPPFGKNSAEYFEKMKVIAENCNIKNISMGMSSDYANAIACGSTEIRIGKLVFSERVKNY